MASNLLTKRLHQQRDRIAGMLAPGAKTALGQQPFSPLLPGFGGQKFRLAARKMLSLDPARLGNLRPEKILRSLTGPLNEAKSLLHLKPAAQDDLNFWSEVETIFPSATAEPESPSRPGELRQGSIIPRMAMFPKPGQSIESFKEQVQQYPKVSPAPAEPPKPQIVPKSRLFSRVQEIATPKTSDELPGGPPAEEIIQPQPDFERQPAPDLPKKLVDVEKPTQAAEPTSLSAPLAESKTARADETHSLPPAPQPEAASKAVAPVPDDKTVPLARTVPVQTQKPATPLPGDETVPLARAMPVQTQKPTPAERILPRAVPLPKQPQTAAPHTTPAQAQKLDVQAKPTEQKAAPPSTPKVTSKARSIAEVPAKPASQPTSIVAPHAPLHPESAPPPPLDLPAPVDEPSAAKLFTSPALPEAAKPTPETGPAPVSKPDTTPSNEMPLRKQAAYRRQAPAKLKALTPQDVKPKMAAPALAHTEKPLIPPQKYHRAAPAMVARQPDERPLPDFLRPAPTQETLEKPQPATAPQAQRVEPESSAQPISTSSTSPVSMSLAYPPRRVEQVPPTPTQPVTPTVTMPVETTPQKSTSPAVASSPAIHPASVQNVVQRKWPENEGGPSSGDSGSGQTSGSSGAGQAQPDFDLAQLAEDVFPYVKRLIEIESDRVSSRFR